MLSNGESSAFSTDDEKTILGERVSSLKRSSVVEVQPLQRISSSWVSSVVEGKEHAISLDPGMHSFEFKDRAGRIVPVHYYIGGDFSVGVDTSEPPTAEDAEDVHEQERAFALHDQHVDEAHHDPDHDGPPTAPGADEDTSDQGDLAFEAECLAHEAEMISQSVLFVCHGVLRNATDYCHNWVNLAERFNLMIVCPQFTYALPAFGPGYPAPLLTYTACAATRRSLQSCITTAASLAAPSRYLGRSHRLNTSSTCCLWQASRKTATLSSAILPARSLRTDLFCSRPWAAGACRSCLRTQAGTLCRKSTRRRTCGRTR